MTGGVSCPPVEATASTAPANSGLKPERFIIGMVKAPVAATLATLLPEIMPMKPLEMTATWAGPARLRPPRARPIAMMNSMPPVTCRMPAKIMNRKIVPAESSVSPPRRPWK